MSPNIDEIEIELDSDPDAPNVLASASFTFAGLKVRRARIIKLPTGRLHLAFPDEPRTVGCPACDKPVRVVWRFCSHCGAALPPRRHEFDRLWFDRVHPVDAATRRAIEMPVLEAYLAEFRRAMAARSA